MRSGLALLSVVPLGACLPESPETGGGECFVEEECVRGETCARDGVCWPDEDVRPVLTTWTLRGMPANETTCTRHPDLYIRFDGNVSDDLGFSPVPCAIGQFSVDKLPRPFTRVEVGVYKSGPWNATSIPTSGTAQLDLTFF